jgi:hypothetical protein
MEWGLNLSMPLNDEVFQANLVLNKKAVKTGKYC